MLNKIQEILRDYTELSPEDIVLESNIRKDLALTSLDVINIIMSIEDAFGIEIDDEDISGLLTIGDVVEYIEKKLSN